MKKVKMIEKPSVWGFLWLLWLFYGLAQKMRGEEHLLPQGPRELLCQFLAGRSVLVVEHRRIVGHFTIWHLQDDWYEAGSIWVHSDYRGQSWAKKMVALLYARHYNLNIMMTTTSSIMRRLMQEMHMKEVRFEQLPEHIHRLTCICPAEKTGATNNAHCALKNRKCVAYMRLAH